MCVRHGHTYIHLVLAFSVSQKNCSSFGDACFGSEVHINSVESHELIPTTDHYNYCLWQFIKQDNSDCVPNFCHC